MHSSITFTAHYEWKQYIDGPSYFRGSIASDNDLQAVYVTDSSGKTVQHLIKSTAKEAEIFLYVQHADYYTVHFVPKPDTQTTATIALRTVPLKSSQYLSPKQSVISPLLASAAEQIAQHNAFAAARFWQTVNAQGTPLIEAHSDGKSVVTFLHQGDALTRNVLVLGAPYDGQAHLTQLANSDIWFKSYVIPSSSRFSYRIAVNVPQLAENNWTEQYLAAFSTVMVDPKNRHAKFGEPDAPYGLASTVTLPLAPNDSATWESDAPKGSLKALHYYSHQLDNARVVQIYEPNGVYPISESSPLLIMFDGSDYLSKVPTPVILDNLIAQGAIPPLRAVFIDTPSPKLRAKELTPNPEYANFLATEFKPWLSERFNIKPSAANTILAGSSFGGLASMYIAFHYPDQFGKVLSQSGSFWWAPESAKPRALGGVTAHWFAELVAKQPMQPIEIYMNAGLFEISPKAYEILETNRTLAATFKAKGYPFTFEEVACGHDYFSWRVTLAHGLVALFNQP